MDLKFEFTGINYYDGQGFIVPKELGVSSAKELSGATVCVQTGTTTELNLSDYFRKNNMDYEPVPIETNSEAQQQYLAGACDTYTTDASGLAATRAAFESPGDHVILPEIISKEPLGPLVRHGDDEWEDVVRWTLNALIAAEEYGITSANIDELEQRHGQPRDQPDPRLRGQSRRDARPRCRLGVPRDQGERQLRRDLRQEHRRVDPDRPFARSQRAVDRRRTDVRTALPLIAATGRARLRALPHAIR